MKTKILLSSVLTIALCLCLIAGSTFALFTTSDSVNVSVTAGKVNLTAVYDTDSMLTWSLYQTEADARKDGIFANSGTAIFVGDLVEIDRMTPGDVAKFKIDVTNYSNVGIQYRVRMISSPDGTRVDLTEALVTTAYIDGFNYPVTGTENATPWRYIDEYEEINDIWITVSFPNNGTVPAKDYNGDGLRNDNDYQEAKARMTFIVEAVQGNADHFSTSKTEAAVTEGQDWECYLDNKIHNGEGATVQVTNFAYGLAGEVTLADITLDGTNKEEFNTLLWHTGEADSTLILAAGANLIGRNDELVVRCSNGYDGTFTFLMDKDAKISVSGKDCYALLAQLGTVNVVLNGSLDECFELSNGARAFSFSGDPYSNAPIIVNIFVNSYEDMQEYKAYIDAEYAIINWYVNGTPVNYTNN